MGQLLHGSARTTTTLRRAIQQSEESIAKLAERYHLNPKTVAKWKKRTHVHDAPMGLKQPRSTILTLEQEALIVAFRKHTLLPLDDCLYALPATIPYRTRSALHRCLKRHGINRLPEMTGDKPPKKKFKPYPIGSFHIDIAEVRTEEGRLCLCVAIDRTSKFAYAELHEQANQVVAAQFLRHLIAAVPYKIHTALTDNGIQFTNRKRDQYAVHRIFDRVCVPGIWYRPSTHQNQPSLDQWPSGTDEPHPQRSHREDVSLPNPSLPERASAGLPDGL